MQSITEDTMMLQDFFCHLTGSSEAKQLSRGAREIAAGNEVLYHGTRCPRVILRSGLLFYSLVGDPSVSFTRSPEVAAYWALLPGRDREESTGAVLVFDRRRLAQRYAIESHHDPIWDDCGSRRDEQEEVVWRRDIDIRRLLLGVVWQERKPIKTNVDVPAKWAARLNVAAAELDRLYRELPVGPQRV